MGGGIGAMAGYAVATYLMPPPRFDVEWNRFEEDEADQIAFADVLSGLDVEPRHVAIAGFDCAAMFELNIEPIA